MVERILFDFAVNLLQETNKTESVNTSNKVFGWNLKPSSEFHIGFLSISLIVGLGYGGYVSYKCWTEGNVFLSYVRNLIIALVCRTFFTILVDGVVILGASYNGSANVLLAFESISLNLVYAFWLLLTLYLHSRMHNNFNIEPCMELYLFGIPGVAVFFSLVWTFSMEGEFSFVSWWWINFTNPITQWITSSLRLLYLIIQLGLLIDIGRTSMTKSSLDNDSVSLLRKISILMGAMVLIFWLHFGLSVGRAPKTDVQPYLYFYYFIDGLQCALLCPIFYFFDIWVTDLSCKISPVLTTSGENLRVPTKSEMLMNGSDGKKLVTLDSVFMTRESGKWEKEASKENKDVVYSSVVQPEKLKKTIELYKRLNLIPNNEILTVEGDEFYDCQSEDKIPRRNSKETSEQRNFTEYDEKHKKITTSGKVTKKNAFYSSKYLILESKERIAKKINEENFSEQSGPMQEQSLENIKRNSHSSIGSESPNKYVAKWLKDCTYNENKKNDIQEEFTQKTKVEDFADEKKKKTLKLEKSITPKPHENDSKIFYENELKDRIARSNELNDVQKKSKSILMKDKADILIFGETKSKPALSKEKINETSKHKILLRKRKAKEADPIKKNEKRIKYKKNKVDKISLDENRKSGGKNIKAKVNLGAVNDTEETEREAEKRNLDQSISINSNTFQEIVDSTESEFEIEKFERNSSVSNSSFSLDKYYSKIIENKQKFQT